MRGRPDSRSIPAPVFEVLRDYLAARASFGEAELQTVRSAFLFRRLSAGEYLQRAGDVTRHAAFVARGCLRSYVIDAKGKEHIVQFAPEGWWISDLYSFLTGKAAGYFIDALEDSDVLLIDSASYEKLCTTVPKFERYFRILLQNNYIATHRRVLASISLSAEEQYVQMLQDFPTIVRRVAQKHIASYLGITPEALSRIRNRIARQAQSRP